MLEPSVLHLAAFARGSVSPEQFEPWLYQAKGLELILGADLHLTAISTDFRSSAAVNSLRASTAAWFEGAYASICPCSTWPDSYQCGLGYDTSDLVPERFNTVRQRNPWLELVRCNGCGQHWYLATDTVDDDFYFRRLSDQQVSDILEANQWPTEFDDVKNVWPL